MKKFNEKDLKPKKKKFKIKHTKFTKGLMNSDNITDKVKEHLIKFIETVQHNDLVELFELAAELEGVLALKTPDITREENHLTGILLVIVQDELKLRGHGAEA